MAGKDAVECSARNRSACRWQVLRDPMRILVTDDNDTVRELICQYVHLRLPEATVGDADSGAGALDKVQAGEWDLVLLDVMMPLQNGVATLRALKRRYPGLKVLMLSAYGDDHFVGDACRAGAHGYVLKDRVATDLVPAVTEVLQGQTYVSEPLRQFWCIRPKGWRTGEG
jgi:DNA-binding NarL/FixJ family response regulator